MSLQIVNSFKKNYPNHHCMVPAPQRNNSLTILHQRVAKTIPITLHPVLPPASERKIFIDNSFLHQELKCLAAHFSL